MNLTDDQIWDLDFNKEVVIDGHFYRHKDYLYKSEIRKDGHLIIRINNKLAYDDPARIEYV